jgi:hypothetical protein
LPHRRVSGALEETLDGERRLVIKREAKSNL